MQKAEKTNEFSASTEQNLPVAPTGNTGEELPAKLARTASTSIRHDKPELTPATDSSASGPAASAQTASAAGESSHWPSAAPARSLERAHDLMSLHAFRLRDSGADSLQMVIKPGPGLQLSLNLQMRNGTVEMHARLNRGDFDFFNKHWSELQQQLEARGVRLAPLTCGEQSVGGGKHSFQQPGRQTEADTAPTGAFAEFALAGAMKPAATTKTITPPRGWESWA